jgi:hypothetical protein
VRGNVPELRSLEGLECQRDGLVEVQHGALAPGAIDQFVDSTDVLSYPQRFRELGNIYASRAKL